MTTVFITVFDDVYLYNIQYMILHVIFLKIESDVLLKNIIFRYIIQRI